MNLLKKIASVMLLVLWVPATSHCLLVAISELDSFACCSHEETAPASHPNECESDECAVLESGLYKTESGMVIPPRPVPTCTSLEPLDRAERSSGPSAFGLASVAPPDLVSTRHFRTRCALPARAPDRLS